MNKTNVFYIINELLREKKYEAAKILTDRFANNPIANSIYISDGDNKSYDSGLVEFLQSNTYYQNNKCGFTAYFK